jgi:hypothetical protein
VAERKTADVAQDEILVAVNQACLERFPDAITVVDYNDAGKVRVTTIMKKGLCGSMASEPSAAITEVKKWLDEMESKLPS